MKIAKMKMWVRVMRMGGRLRGGRGYECKSTNADVFTAQKD